MQLAIDTSTDNAGIALLDGANVIFELTWRCGKNHTIELLPRLNFLFKQHKIDMKAVDAVIVALGPGSFNGIRVGLATAKGLALSLGIPVAGVSTLSLQAYPHSVTELPISVVLNAGRSEIATATYQSLDGKWTQLAPERITTLDTLIQETSTKTVFCGDYLPQIESQLKSTLGEKAVVPSQPANLRRSAYLAELGRMELESGRTQDPAIVQPIYLRRPAITTPKKRLSYGKSE